MRSGLAPVGTPFLQAYHGEDIRGFHVITDGITLADAAYATAVTIIPIIIPEELDTVKAPAALLMKFAFPPKTYWVQGSASVAADLFKGGTTPLALIMARSLAANPGILTQPEAELAEQLDRMMWGERHAAEEEERQLHQMLIAERDRRCAVENLGFGRGGAPVHSKTP